jgi:hypothetical protein
MSYAHLWDELRDKRNRRLKASDWTQMPDSPLSTSKKAEWATYRQALRDIPSKWANDVNKNTVNPFNGDVKNIWPTKPD